MMTEDHRNILVLIPFRSRERVCMQYLVLNLLRDFPLQLALFSLMCGHLMTCRLIV